jgi:hypothetical protein
MLFVFAMMCCSDAVEGFQITDFGFFLNFDLWIYLGFGFWDFAIYQLFPEGLFSGMENFSFLV